ETIGRGGMGVVYLAEQRDPIERRVALKLVQSGLQTAEAFARFEAERRALGLMNHANIARVFEAGTTDGGRPYFVMEYVSGDSIIGYADQQRLSVRERVELFLQVLDALQHAHQKGIIHRDVKPGNILVGTSEGKPRVKVIDFGVAKALDRRLTPATLHTRAGRIVGTLEYMSPEQCSGDRRGDDTRSDLYSAGLVLYELLVGGLPFERERFQSSSLAEIHEMICEAEPPLPSSRVRSISVETIERRRSDRVKLTRALRGDFDSILMKALEKSQIRRYQSAIELREDLVRALEDRPISASPPSGWNAVRKFVRRHRIAVIAATIVVLALSVGLVTASLGLQEAARERTAAIEALEKVEEEARKARTAMTFLQETLVAASPGSTQGDDDRVLVEMLEGATRRMSSALAEFPAVETELRITLAVTFLGLGRLEEAKEQAELARNRLAQLGEISPTVRVELGIVEGMIQVNLAQSAEGEEKLRETLLLADALSAESTTAESLRSRVRKDLGWVVLQRHELAEAERLAREALSYPDSTDPNHIAANNLLALSLKYQKKYEEAESIYRQTWTHARALGEDHPLVAQVENNLGMLLIYDDRDDEAEVMLQAALDRRNRIFSGDHPALAESYNNLGLIKSRRDKKAEAIPLYERARDILEASVEPNHPNLASLAFNIAELYESQRDAKSAAIEYRRALAIDESHYGAEHAYVARGRFQLARALFRSEDYTAAESMAEKALVSYRAVEATEPWELARAMSLHASCLVKAERYEEAESELLDAHRRVVEQLGGEHARTRAVRQILHRLYQAWGKPERATAWD
ncbi:MAG: serine/threonine-protein kinase, partial [Planctomycetota bacterium]